MSDDVRRCQTMFLGRLSSLSTEATRIIAYVVVRGRLMLTMRLLTLIGTMTQAILNTKFKQCRYISLLNAKIILDIFSLVGNENEREVKKEMKTYKNLYAQLISDDLLMTAIKNASVKKTRKKKDKYENRIASFGGVSNYLQHIRHYIENFHNTKHTPLTIYDGISRKKRNIIVPSIDEQVVHHAIVLVLKPLFMQGMYYHSNAAIPDRGCHRGKRYMQKWVKNYDWCFKADIRHFFESIDHSVLKSMFAKKIKDDKFLQLLYKVIDVVNKGIPIGFYTSQWISNWFLMEFDHYVKETLKAKYYMRYMDDIVILGDSKEDLQNIKNGVVKYLSDIKLEIKPNWRIFNLNHNFIDFMGFRFYKNRTTLRRSIFLKACRKARKISRKLQYTIHDCRQVLSYIGWLKATNTYYAYVKYIKPLVNFGEIRRYVSEFDKRRLSNGI